MSDFLFWNLIFLIAWVAFRIFRMLLPKGRVFSVVHVSASQIGGQNAVVLINDKRVAVFRHGALWRYKTTGSVLPEEWADIIERHGQP